MDGDEGTSMHTQLLSYYEAIERASADMLAAAKTGNWDEVVKLEGEAAKAKSRIMQRILINDAEIRHLAEPWLQDLDDTLAGRHKTLH